MEILAAAKGKGMEVGILPPGYQQHFDHRFVPYWSWHAPGKN